MRAAKSRCREESRASSSSSRGELRELDRIHQPLPDPLARVADRERELGLVLLEQRHQLQYERLVALVQIVEIALLVIVVVAQPVDEIIEVVLQRELGERADRGGG